MNTMSPSRTLPLAALALVALGCKPPPPAPEGLQSSLTYLFREFYNEDEYIGAGLTGFMDWFDADGDELLGEQADMENVGEFTLDYLSEDDIAALPVEGEYVLEHAPGVVALSELACDWKQVESYLVRTDQDLVFGEFDTYDRTFVSSRQSFEDATTDSSFEAVIEPLAEPYSQPELGELEASVLLTDNAVSSTELGITMEFPMLINMRHGVYDVQGEDMEALLILSWMPERAEADNERDSIEQSYSIELDLARPGGKTLRLMASWLQIEGTFGHDSDVVKVMGVNKNLDGSKRLVDICDGSYELDPE